MSVGTANSGVAATLPPSLPRDDASLAIPRGRNQRIALSIIVGALLVWLLVRAIQNPRFEWDIVGQYFTASAIMSGLATSLYLTVILFFFSAILGTLLAVARSSKFAPLRVFSWIYNWVFRAVPALVQIILWFNLAYLVPTLSLSIPFGPTLFEIPTNDVISPFTAAVLGLGLCEAAYMAEIIRAGLASVDRGQNDAAHAIGLNDRQAFFRIVLPQSMRFIIPPLGSQTILILKGTSLVSVIALSDLLHSAQAIYNRTLDVVPLLMVATIWYLIIVSVMSVLQLGLEHFFNRSNRDTRDVQIAERSTL